MNKGGNKYKRAQNFGNVHNLIKCTLQCNYNMLQYEIYSSLPSLKLHNEIHSTSQNCTMKYTKEFSDKLIFLCVLILLN